MLEKIKKLKVHIGWKSIILIGVCVVLVLIDLLTKIFEEIVIDDTEKVIEHFNNNILKGEIVGLVFRDENSADDIDLDEKISVLKSKNFKDKEISIILSELYGLNKNEVYKKCLM